MARAGYRSDEDGVGRQFRERTGRHERAEAVATLDEKLKAFEEDREVLIDRMEETERKLSESNLFVVFGISFKSWLFPNACVSGLCSYASQVASREARGAPGVPRR